MVWRFVKTSSLSLRLAITLSLSILCIAAMYLIIQSIVVERFSDSLVKQSLLGQAADISEGLRIDQSTGAVNVNLEPQDAFGFDAYYANLQFRVLDSGGQVVASSVEKFNSLLDGVPLEDQSNHYARKIVDGVDLHIVSVHHQLGDQLFTVQLARSDGFTQLAHQAITPAVAETVGMVAVVSILIISFMSYLGIRSLLRPIRDVSEAASSMDQTNLSERLRFDHLPSEIHPLIHAFNGVLDRLELAFSSQQRFFSNAAHELKTPLALLRAQLDSSPEKTSEQTLQYIDSLGRTVNQLLHLAEISSGRARPMRSVSVIDAVEEAAQFLSWRADRKSVTICITQSRGVDVRLHADPGELFVLVKNMLENAVDFAPIDSTIYVRIRPDYFEVEDQGCGISKEDRERVFDRFWKGSQTDRQGSGLGLAICKEIAVAHGWSISCSSQPGKGTVFRVTTALLSPTSGNSR